MMDRRIFLTTVAGLLLTPLTAEAQQAGKVPRVGILWAGALPSGSTNPNPFDEELRKLGWVEGQNITMERRYAEGRYERFPDLAAELVRLKVDVILPGGGPGSLKAAREATKTIPIVMVASSIDPVGDGLIKSFAQPGGNITGLVVAPREVWTKRFQLLKEAVPGLSRVGLLFDGTLGVSKEVAWTRTEEVLRPFRLDLLRIFEVREPTALANVVRAAMKEQVGCLLVQGTPMFVRLRGEISDLLMKHRLPAMSEWRDFPEAGLLMSYGSSRPEEFRRAAHFVDKILKGAKPGDLPVEQPMKFELVINLKTAKALGLTIPQSVLVQADEVIQ